MRKSLAVVAIGVLVAAISGCILLNEQPIAAFDMVPEGGFAPLAVAFDASMSTDADGSISEYTWRFGDSTQGTGPAATHTYNSSGTYVVGLTVKDDLGARGEEASGKVYVGDVVPYDDLFRNNESYIGGIIHVRGEIIQVREFLGSYDWRVATSESQFGGYLGDIIWANYSRARYLEGDIIEMCAEVRGLRSYTAILGQQVTIPEVNVLWVQLSE